jgi:protein-tyrosine phosphatase
MAPFHVVFVCSGNICRSPVAEKVFAHEIERAGLADRVRVSSAGTGSWHVGDPADERAAALLVEHGYDDTHVARQVDEELLAADLLVALDDGHLRALRRIAPDGGRVALLRSFDPAAPPGSGVPDPYYGGPDGFTEVMAMTRAAVPGLL